MSIFFGVGVIGKKEDVEHYAKIMLQVFEKHAHRVNDQLFGGRLQLLVPEEYEDHGND